MFRLAREKELTDHKLSEFIGKHAGLVTGHFKELEDAYKTRYPILDEPPKPKYKPDNRIMVNFAKYIVDTMNGYFIGHSIKTTVDEGADAVKEFVEMLDQYNDQDDNNAELSKLCSIFGRAYEMYYIDDRGNIGITYVSPMEGFMIYDDSVLERPRAFVRLYRDDDNVLHGSISDETTVRYFTQKGRIVWEDLQMHGFDGVPATEYKENEEAIGIFEPVLTMINAYNKAVSEKANDVDYFADAYLKVIGTLLNEDEIKNIRSDRIINFDVESSNLAVEFLQKPSGDATQENLINRLERLIFQISMVADISDENFGTSSGIALKYKLLAMSNLAKTKERKFTSGLNRRYKLIFSNPLSGMNKDDWMKLHFKFTQNIPSNLQEEAQIAAQLSGIVSEETQLSVLSIVDDVKKEMEKKEAEEPADKLGFELSGFNEEGESDITDGLTND